MKCAVFPRGVREGWSRGLTPELRPEYWKDSWERTFQAEERACTNFWGLDLLEECEDVQCDWTLRMKGRVARGEVRETKQPGPK